MINKPNNPNPCKWCGLFVSEKSGTNQLHDTCRPHYLAFKSRAFTINLMLSLSIAGIVILYLMTR
jgi:hypothetical protein